MVYVKTTWSEFVGTGEEKATWMNNMETQYDEVVSYYTTTLHDDTYYTKEESDAKFFGPARQGSDSGFVCERVDGYTTVDIMGSQVPPGTIVIWGGTGSIPSGWSRFIPLDDRYPVVAGNNYVLGQSGGAASVSSTTATYTFQIGAHALSISELPPHNHTGALDYLDTASTSVRGGQSQTALGPDIEELVNTESTGSGVAHTHDAVLGAGSEISLNNMPASRTYYYIIKG